MKIIDVAAPSISDGSDISIWLMIGMAALFVIILLIVFLLKRKGKKKKYNYVFLLFMLLFSVKNVFADAGGPVVISYDIVVSNNSGAACYKTDNNGKYVKTGKTIAKGKTFTVYDEIYNGYIGIYEDNCEYISAKDIKTKNDKLDVNNKEVSKITPVKAVILAKGGLNMRKGPAVAYGRVTTVPQYSIVTLSRRAGTYWYYAEYNGKSGWISGINNYFAIETDKVLLSYKSTPIYSIGDNPKQIGNIPALTEITDYLELVSEFDGENLYVNYNGVKGTINQVPFKVNGKIKLLKDTNIYQNNKVIGTAKTGEVLDYTTETYEYLESDDKTYYIFYVPSLNGIVRFNSSEEHNFEYVIKEPEPIKKTKGFLGEGLFGEKKTKIEEPTTTPEAIDEPLDNPIDEQKNNKTPKEKNNELIIICVLGSIILALTIIIIILLVNRKKSKRVTYVEKEIVTKVPIEESSSVNSSEEKEDKEEKGNVEENEKTKTE